MVHFYVTCHETNIIPHLFFLLFHCFYFYFYSFHFFFFLFLLFVYFVIYYFFQSVFQISANIVERWYYQLDSHFFLFLYIIRHLYGFESRIWLKNLNPEISIRCFCNVFFCLFIQPPINFYLWIPKYKTNVFV